MKTVRFPLAVCLALVFLLPAIAAFPFPNEPNGFRGVSWGEDISKVEGMECKGYRCTEFRSLPAVKETYDYKVFERRGEMLRLGAVPLLGIQYYAWRDRFRGVSVTAPARERNRLLKILEGRFGKGTVTSSAGSGASGMVTWVGKQTGIAMSSHYTSVEVEIYSVEIATEERRARRSDSTEGLREGETMDNNAIRQGEGF